MTPSHSFPYDRDETHHCVIGVLVSTPTSKGSVNSACVWSEIANGIYIIKSNQNAGVWRAGMRSQLRPAEAETARELCEPVIFEALGEIFGCRAFSSICLWLAE